MSNLLMILAALFVTLFAVTTIAGRFAKPVAPEQQQKYSLLIMILMGLVLLGAGIRYLTGG